jgi:hypothetical protein
VKAKYAVLICLFVVSSLGGVGYAIHDNSYESGKSFKEREWQDKWNKRDLADRAAQLQMNKRSAKKSAADNWKRMEL